MQFTTVSGKFVIVNEDAFEVIEITPVEVGLYRIDCIRSVVPCEVSPGWTEPAPKTYRISEEEFVNLALDEEDYEEEATNGE